MAQPSPPPGPAGAADRPQIDWQAALAEHDRWLRTVVYTRLGEPQAVDDVMQEVALAAVRQQAPLADPAKVAPWLYRLAIRQTLLYRRKQGRRRRLVESYARRTRPTERAREADALGWLLAEERGATVRAALAALAPGDAEILVLKYSEDWSYRELAERLGISVSALQARLHRARRRLREQLAASEVFDESSRREPLAD